jgi:hypothetical protein
VRAGRDQHEPATAQGLGPEHGRIIAPRAAVSTYGP